MEIAVFQDNSGRTQSFVEPGIVKVYSRHMGEWKITKEIIYRIDNIASLKEIRQSIRNMAETLGDCKVFVGREIKGLPYTVLDSMGFNTWELEGTTKDLLEFVFEKEEEETKSMEMSKSKDKLPLIQKSRDGYYFLNLKKIQEHNINLTSKGILLPFFDTTVFYQLEIICGHIPPWFEAEFNRLNLITKSESISKDEIKITVYPKGCGE
ncbi:Fe-only nitrogenase accessory protein AnfO [Clostridium algoriphilum]|uniref:Fe-only nitrogenase accessory protein AnfO n=1 Tax=Clostridium algoriphilum TaxID=198347 RepID=UPI001CF52578|nr:Fe-only nitrogenase accessory protein AnfO [Clostridium algoriphilum]MCB2293866.1 Fe-only nitrogenase accessory protein AnfO [Clostridium algoriphilum]